MGGAKSRVIGRVRERSRLLLEPLESRILLSATDPFTAPVFTAVAGTPQLVTGTANTSDSFDADRNGFNDVVISYDDGGSPPAISHVSIMLGQSGGSYTEQNIAAPAGRIVQADLADFHSGTTPDVAVQWESFTGGVATQGHIDVYLNNGNGTFTQAGSDILVAPGSEMHILDMNGDGKQDLFVTNPTNDGVSVYLNKGDGTFQSPVTTNFGSGKTITYFNSDLNGDQVLDVLLNYTGTPQLPDFTVPSILEEHLGHADGSFNVAADWTDPANDSHFQSVEKFSGASSADLLVYHRASFSPTDSTDVVVFKNDGTGQFANTFTKTLANGYAGNGVAVDLNLDNKLDLVLTDGVATLSSQRTVFVERGAGNATFTETQTLPINNLVFGEIGGFTDVDHDGFPDLVADIWATNGGGIATDWGAQIFFNHHDCTFLTSPVTVKPAVAPTAIELPLPLDLNSDHLLDMTFVDDPQDTSTADQISVFMNSGGRTFGPEKITDFGANTRLNFELFDLNGDGNADAIPSFNVDAQGTATGFTFWQGNGDGTFTSAASPDLFPSGGRAQDGAIPISFKVGGSNIDLLFIGTSPTGLDVALNTTNTGGGGDHTAPTADLADPVNGGSISLTTLNSRHTLDVTFSDTGGSGLNASTITDAGQEFSLSGAGAAGVSVNGAPTLVSGTWYRYSFTGSFSAGPVNVNFTAGSWADVAGNHNAAAVEGFTVTAAVDTTPPTADLSDPANNGAIAVADLNARGTLDVTFADAGGSGLDASTVTDAGSEFTLSGAAAAGVTLNGAPALVSGTTYRYSFTGSFTTGPVGVNFTAGSWADNAGNPNAAASEGFDVVASAALVPIAQQTSADGVVHVTIYDVVGPVDVDPSKVKVVFGKNDAITSIALSGTQPMEGLGIVISGATSVGAITDTRTTPGTVAFIAADSAIASLTLKSGTSGYNLNGLSLGGLIFPADIDGDGSTTDATALFCTGYVSTVSLGGPASGDFWISGIDPKTLLSNKSFTVKNGGLHGDLVTEGAEGAVALAGDFNSQMTIAGTLTSLTIKGGNFSGMLDATGPVGTVAISSQTVAGVPVGGGVTAGATIDVTGADPKTNLSLKSFSATGTISGLDMMLSGGLGTLKCAGWTGGSLHAASSGAVTLNGDFATQWNLTGGLTSLTLKGGNFGGSLTAGGPVGGIAITPLKVAGVNVGGAVTTGAVINVTGMDAKTGVSLKSLSAAGPITGLDMTLSGGLGTLTGGGWTGGSLHATSSGAITLNGDFATQWNLTGPLASLTIKGGNYAGSFTGLGPVGVISISSQKIGGLTVGGNIMSGAAFNFNGVDPKTNLGLKSLTATGTVADLNLTSASGLGSITTGSWTGGGVTAPFLNSLMVKGDMTGAAIHLDGQNAKGDSLSYFGTINWLRDTELRTAANIDSVTVGGIDHSNVYAGIAPGVTGLPTFAGSFVAPAKISSFTVKGTVKLGGDFSLIGSNIAAHDIGTMSLAGVDDDNGGVPFGVAAFSIVSVTGRDINGAFHFVHLDLPSDSVVKQDANILILTQIF